MLQLIVQKTELHERGEVFLLRKKFDVEKLRIILITALCCIGLLLGTYGLMNLLSGNDEDDFVTENLVEVPREIQRQAGSDQIAVINLDVGVELANGNHVYHSTNAIRLPSDDFRFTSLSDARLGLDENRFGAYIIIPADFSRNIESLNTIPTQIELEYRIGHLLNAEEQKSVLYTVLRFGDNLNMDLSYVYLSNVLTEFHQVQDNSIVLMENDRLTAEAISAIRAEDLVEMIQLPTLTRTEHDIDLLDISGNMDAIRQLIMDLHDAYNGKIDLNNEQLTLLTQQGDAIIQELNNLIGGINAINLIYNEYGERVYADGRLNLTNFLTQFNSNLLGTQLDDIDTLIVTIQNEAGHIETSLDWSVQIHNDRMDAVVIMPANVPSLAQNTISAGQHYSISSSAGSTVTIELIANPIPGNISANQTNQTALNNILGIILSNPSVTINDALASASVAVGKDSAQFLSGIISGSNPLNAPRYAHSIVLTGDVSALADDMLAPLVALEQELTPAFLRFAPFYYDNNGDINLYNGTELTLNDLFSDFSLSLDNMRTDLGNIQGINIAAIEDIVENELLSPLVAQSTNVQTEITERQQEEIDFIQIYIQQIGLFDPATDVAVMGSVFGDLSENSDDLFILVMENNQAYRELNQLIYSNTDEHVEAIRETINEAAEASRLMVEMGLSETQELSYFLSSENQEILGDFAERLPFTRLGTVEFSTAYEFMVRPMRLYRIGMEGILRDEEVVMQPELTPAASIPGGAQINRVTNIWLLLILAGVLFAISVAIGLFLKERIKNKKESF